MGVATKVIGVLRSLYGLHIDEPNVLNQRKDANPQRLRISHVHTDENNYERFAINTGSGEIELAAERAGAGHTNIGLALRPTGSGAIKLAGTDVHFNLAPGQSPGVANSVHRLILKKTNIPDNVSVPILTFTIPNGNHAAGLRLSILTTNGGPDAFESSRFFTAQAVFTRVAGSVAATFAAPSIPSIIATVAGGATHAAAFGLGTVIGSGTSVNTVIGNIVVNDSGDVGGNQVMVIAELMNAENNGITMVPV